MDKRRYQRVKVLNVAADLSDGYGFFSGTVCDISHNGMLLEDIPKKLNSQTKKLTVIVSAGGKNIRIMAAPRWVGGNERIKSLGIEILDAPAKWADFVRKHEPKNVDDDVWASVAITR